MSINSICIHVLMVQFTLELCFKHLAQLLIWQYRVLIHVLATCGRKWCKSTPKPNNLFTKNLQISMFGKDKTKQ